MANVQGWLGIYMAKILHGLLGGITQFYLPPQLPATELEDFAAPCAYAYDS